MNRRGAKIALIAAGVVVLALVTVFAIVLSNTQAKSKQDVETRVHERAVLAAALIDSLLQTIPQQVPQYEARYGTRVVSDRTMDTGAQGDTYLALLDSAGRVLASSHGLTAQARRELSDSVAVRLVRSGRPYGLGDVMPYGRGTLINAAVRFPTPYGVRILVSGSPPATLESFLGDELRQIPGVKGSHNYVLDGNDTVIASNNPAHGSGSRFIDPAEVKALSRSSGDRNGHYYDEVSLANSTWRIVLAAPDGPLFASVTGLRKWVPWMIFIAFAVVAAVALWLGRRLVRSAESGLRHANARLEAVNRELASTNDQLERRALELARSNAELEQFASVASHDLQEPLRKVRTFTEQVTVMESERLSDKGRDYLQRANRSAERMQKLVEDLLRFSRVTTQARPFAAVNLEQLTREVLEDLSLEVERANATVHLGPLPAIGADAPQMRQLLQNLISNALKFRRADVPLEITIEATVTGSDARLVVRDNGIGFEPQYGERIFRIFERLHGRSEYPGTGIGLALCRKIAERHGGSIVAEGHLGEGASFTVTLPLHPANAQTAGVSTDVASSEREEAGARA